jgi:hypothetical protein
MRIRNTDYNDGSGLTEVNYLPPPPQDNVSWFLVRTFLLKVHGIPPTSEIGLSTGY